MRASIFNWVKLSGWGQSRVQLSQVRCPVSPFSLQTWFPGVTVWFEVGVTEHPAGTPVCVLDAPGMCLGMGLSTQNLHKHNGCLNAPIIHSSIWKKSWFKGTEMFPFSQTKCLAGQIRNIRDPDFPARCTALPTEGEDSLVFIPPDKTGCLLAWQIAIIEGFDPETGEIKEEKKKSYMILWSFVNVNLIKNRTL